MIIPEFLNLFHSADFMLIINGDRSHIVEEACYVRLEDVTYIAIVFLDH